MDDVFLIIEYDDIIDTVCVLCDVKESGAEFVSVITASFR
jgi:hypothetical protein